MTSMLVSLSEPVGEDRLVSAAARGDRAAFGELYVRYARLVHGILLARVPHGTAEDLVQDVFLTAMRRVGELRSPAAFGGWLAAIARRRATDFFRDGRHWTVLDPQSARQRAAGDKPTEALVILDAIRHLPEAYREPLILRLVEGMTGPEIAEQTGLTPESVRVNLCRGMKLLREVWEAKPND
jgi:RNA polymerase sigma-70 factor (ECF subfamily)